MTAKQEVSVRLFPSTKKQNGTFALNLGFLQKNKLYGKQGLSYFLFSKMIFSIKPLFIFKEI